MMTQFQYISSLPPSLGNLSNLQFLWAQYNYLSRPIPSSHGSLVDINSLTLDNNQLTGSVPNSFCSLAGINQLTLNDNYLVGTIPNCLFDKDMAEFAVRYNYYNFEELAYGKSKAGEDFLIYAPQKLEFVDTVYVQGSGTIDLSVDDGNYQGAQSSYRWKKDGTWMHSASPTNKTINMNCGTSACEGLYHLEITNPDFPVGARLAGDVYYIKIGADLSQTICMAD